MLCMYLLSAALQQLLYVANIDAGWLARYTPGDVLGDLVSQPLVGALVLLGAGEHLLHILSHGLLVVTVAVSSGGVVLHSTPYGLALLCC